MNAFFPGIEDIVRCVIQNYQFDDCEGVEEELFNEKRYKDVMRALFGPKYNTDNLLHPPKNFGYTDISRIRKMYAEGMPLETAIHETVNASYPLPEKPKTQHEEILLQYDGDVVNCENWREAAFDRLKKFFQRHPDLTVRSSSYQHDEIIQMVLEDIENERRNLRDALRKCGWPI